jgi:hypothetical protein
MANSKRSRAAARRPPGPARQVNGQVTAPSTQRDRPNPPTPQSQTQRNQPAPPAAPRVQPPTAPPPINRGQQAPPRRSPRPPLARSRRQVWWRSPAALVASVVVVAVIIVSFVAISARQGGGAGSGQVAPPAIVEAVTKISPAVSSAVGSGGLPQPLKATPPTPPLLGATNKPDVLYIGAGYCPYCAAERWSMIVALARFGTFGDLHLAQSSGTDVYPNTPTFTFYGSSYHSDYLDFEAVEETGQDQQSRLQAPTAAQQQLFNKYDAAPYTTSPGGIPFLDLANQYIAISSGYSPQVLAGKSWQDIATALADPKAATTQAIVGNANYLTAALCHLTDNQPASTCTVAPIPQLEQQLAAGH